MAKENRPGSQGDKVSVLGKGFKSFPQRAYSIHKKYD